MSYDAVKDTPLTTPIAFTGNIGFLGTWLSISPTDKQNPTGILRYILANERSSKDPVAAIYRCKGDGSLQILSHGVASNSAFPNWTYDFKWGANPGFISGQRRGCVSPHPPQAYIPSDSSYILHVPTNIPYNINSRLFAFCNGLDNMNYSPIQAVFDPAMNQSPWSLYGSSMNIGDIFYGWGKVFVPFEDVTGKLLIATHDAAGIVPFLRKNISARAGGLQEAYFVDEDGKPLSTPPRFYYSNMVFHPTKELAFIADCYDSSIYMINLKDYDTFYLRYRGVKYVHPKSAPTGNDNTRQIAITGDGEYVLCKSQNQNGFKSAIFPFHVTKNESDYPILKPAGAIKPAADSYWPRTMTFAAGAKKGVYVSNNATNELWYFKINEDEDKITTTPLRKISSPAGVLDSIYTDRDRTMLAVRGGGAAPEGDAAYFFKIGNWRYKILFLKPRRLPDSSCRFCEPMLPKDGPVEVKVKITDMDDVIVTSGDADVVLDYIITGPDGVYQSTPKTMDDLGGGEFSTLIHPPHPGDIEIICTVTPKGKSLSDSASLFGCVSDKGTPQISCEVYPKNVIIPYWFKGSGGLKANYVCRVKGTVQWGMAYDYPAKTVSVAGLWNITNAKMQNFTGNNPSDDFDVGFEWRTGEVTQYDSPLQFKLIASAEKGSPPNQEIIISDPFYFTPDPAIYVVSLGKYNSAAFGKYYEIESYLYDTFAHYKWSVKVPPWGDKIGITFKGSDWKIAGASIPILEDIEFNISFYLNLVRSAFSDYQSPVPVESKGGAALGAGAPIPQLPVLKITGQIGADAKALASDMPDPNQMAVRSGASTLDITGAGELGLEVDILKLLNKLKVLEKLSKNPLFAKFLRWFDKLKSNPKMKWVLDKLQAEGSIAGAMGGELNLKGEILDDPNPPLYMRFANFQGELKAYTKVTPTLNCFGGKLKLAIDFMAGTVTDPSELGFNPAQLVCPWAVGKLKYAYLVIKGMMQMGPFILPESTWVDLKYNAASGGSLPKSIYKQQIPDCMKQNYNRLAVKPMEKILADDAPTTLIENVFIFSTPFHISRGYRKMILYIHSRNDLPFERSTEIYYLYIENDALVSSGPAWSDTRFQDYPTAVFTSDGNVLLACQSVKIDDLSFSEDIEILDANNAAAQYMEIAWAVFDTDSLTWSSPTYLTDNALEDFAPQLFTDHKGRPLLLFQTSSQGSFYADPDAHSTLKYSVYESDAFTAPQTLVDPISSGIILDSKDYSNKTWVVYSKDMDDDALTTPDTHLYSLAYSGDTPVWDASPQQITSGAAYNDAPHLLADELGQVRLIWQHNDEIWSSVGEPLGQNPQVLLRNLVRGQIGNIRFFTLPNGDLALFSCGFLPDPGHPGLFNHDLYYDYVDPTTGTLGVVNTTRDGTFDFLMDALPPSEELSKGSSPSDDRIVTLMLQRDLSYGSDPDDTWFEFTPPALAIYNILPLPPDDYVIPILLDVPENVQPDSDFDLELIPNRRMKIYSCDFKIEVDEGITIEGMNENPGLDGSVEPDHKTAYIRRTGGYPVTALDENTPFATLNLHAASDAPFGRHTIILSDEDQKKDFLTTSFSGMKYRQDSGEFLIPASVGWYLH